MSFIEKLRTVRTRFGGGMDSLSRSEQVDILWRAWRLFRTAARPACIGMLIVMVARLVGLLT